MVRWWVERGGDPLHYTLLSSFYPVAAAVVYRALQFAGWFGDNTLSRLLSHAGQERGVNLQAEITKQFLLSSAGGVRVAKSK